MNKYKEIKQILDNEQVVIKYLGEPIKRDRNGVWYKSPFRKERTASFYVSNKGIHDFGDSTHYDIISFIGKYYNTTPYKALQILSNDFNINITENEYQNDYTLKLLKQKREEEKKIKNKIETWFNSEIIKTCDEIIINRKIISILEKKCYYEALAILYDEQVKLEYYFGLLYNANEKEKINLYLEINRS